MLNFRRKSGSSIVAGLSVGIPVISIVGSSSAWAMESAKNDEIGSEYLQEFEKGLDDNGKKCFAAMKKAGLDAKKFEEILQGLKQGRLRTKRFVTADWHYKQ